MTTVHTGDRTTGCDTCLKNDYMNEIIEANNWTMCADTYEGALSAWVDNSPTYYISWRRNNSLENYKTERRTPRKLGPE